jgi:serine/threonine protein kinase/Tfp pilus assembly protein PilF
MHLRMYFHEPAYTLDAASLRAHLAECEVCRAILAGIAAGDKTPDTLADDAMDSPQHMMPPADAGEGSDLRTIVARVDVEGGQWNTLAEDAMDPERRVMPTGGGTTVFRMSRTGSGLEDAFEYRNTLADEAADPVPPVKSPGATTVILPTSENEAGREAGTDSQSTLSDEPVDPAVGEPPTADTAEFARDREGAEPQSADDTTIQLPGRTAGRGESPGLADTWQGNRTDGKNDSADTPVSRPKEPRTIAASYAAGSSLWRDDADRSLAGSPTLKGVTVPGYDILEELGRGGMGVVYKARHRRLGRLVALKMVLAGAHVGQVGLARFRAEAEAVAKLLHSNIVQIYETGEHEGRPYFSLEFVDGGSLDQKLRESPTSPRSAARLMETLARTMDVAHQRGIVHRDLKPANILLARIDSQSSMVRQRELDSSTLPSDHWARSTVPKIADFGLAKRVDEDSSQTQSGTILGTPSYMAPEQASGKNREIGPAADIYSLGAILYELLVGRPPFKASNPIDTVRQVIEQEPVPPRQLEPRVPHDLETICLKCLEKDPAKRFVSAAELADDLRRFVDDEPIRARPTPPWERAWKWGKRRKAIVALMGVCAMAAIGTVLFIAWHNVSLRGRLDVALAKERRARQREQDAIAEQRLSLLQQEAQKLFDSARVSVAASDWPSARLHLEKALTTIGSEARVVDLKEPAQALLKRVEKELRVEADRRESQARFQGFGKLRDEAQFLGTLYTGMDLSANLEAARAAVQQALRVYGVLASKGARPALDDYLSDPQKTEIQGDCYQLLLILAETEAQTAPDRKPLEKAHYLRKALSLLEQAQALKAPSRAFHLRRGRYLSMLGDRNEAAQADKAAQAAPLDDVLDHFLMADELYRREEFADAIKEFDHVLESKPGHFWARYLNAICLLRQGRPAEARTLLSACLAERSDFVWLYLLRGFAQQELQAWSSADSDFQKAAQMPLDDNARYVLSVNRGVLRVKQERFEDAIVDLKAAIERKPKAFQAYVNLANAYRRLGQLAPALEAIDRAAALEPGLAQLYRLRARLYLERNEPAKALADFDQAIARENTNSPHQADDQVERGRILLSGASFAQALGCFDVAIKLQKDHSLAQRLRAETLFRLGRFEEVIAAFDRYLETGKPLESVYRGRGLARAELGQYPGAIEDFTKALELHPTSAVQAFRGWTHLVVDAPKLALRDFELAIELDPKNGDAYNGRGFVRASQGRHREALEDAVEALRQGPTSPRLLYNAARIQAQCPGPGPQRAVALIQQALGLLPEAERTSFWSTHIRTDSALAALHRYPSFMKLDGELSHRK